MNSDTIDWEHLPLHDPLNDEAFKSIVALFPLKLTGNISDKTIFITDDGLELVPYDSKEEGMFEAFYKYLQDLYALPFDTMLVLNHFKAPRKENWGFELEERSHVLSLAIRILTSGKCFRKASFKYSDNTKLPLYYRPFVDNDSLRSGFLGKEASVISSEEDFQKLQTLYSAIFKLKVFKYDDSFSKLLNAVRFYDRSHDANWFLQKIVHTFVALESLFTDQSKSEITYKVSVRTAFLLHPENSSSRNEVFDLLRIAYDVRSSFLHGSKIDEARLTKRLQELKKNDQYSLWYDLPADLNNILSQVLGKILLSSDSLSFFSSDPNPKKESEFYNQLVLGIR